MDRAVVPSQKITPRDVEIPLIDKAAIALDQRGPVEPIELRQPIPGQPVTQVMRRMQVVEQEQRPQDEGVLDDRRAPLRFGHGAMFGE